MNYFVSVLIQLGAGLTNPLVVQQYQQEQIHVHCARATKVLIKIFHSF